MVVVEPILALVLDWLLLFLLFFDHLRLFLEFLDLFVVVGTRLKVGITDRWRSRYQLLFLRHLHEALAAHGWLRDLLVQGPRFKHLVWEPGKQLFCCYLALVSWADRNTIDGRAADSVRPEKL